MTFNQAGGFHDAGAFGHADLALLAAVPAGGVLTRLDIEGIVNADFQGISVAVTSFTQKGAWGGIQYGAHGYGGTAPAANGLGASSWLVTGNLVKEITPNLYLAGTVPFNAGAIICGNISLHWRGAFRCATAQDFYCVVATDFNHAGNLGTGFEFYAEWAS